MNLYSVCQPQNNVEQLNQNFCLRFHQKLSMKTPKKIRGACPQTPLNCNQKCCPPLFMTFLHRCIYAYSLKFCYFSLAVTTSAYYDALLAVISVLAILSASLLVISVSLIVILWWSMRHPSRKAPKKTGEEGITRSQRTLSNSYEPPQTASIQLEIESGPERKSEELKTGNSQTDPKSVITDTREATKTTDTTESEKKPETQKKADVVPAVHRMIKQIESSSSIETQQAKDPV